MTIPWWGWVLAISFVVVWAFLTKYTEENSTPKSRKIDKWMLRLSILAWILVLWSLYMTISIGYAGMPH